jgi:hypothetical protein
MGLLDFDMNDPKTAGLLNIGLGILAGNTGRPGDLGQGLLGGMQNYQQMLAQQQRQKMLEQQQQMQNTQFEWTKADREREQAQRDKQQELMGRLPQTLGINPDVLAAYPQIGQKLLEQQYMPQEPIKLGKGESLYNPTTYQPIVQAPQEKEVKNGYLVQDVNGNWVIDKTLYEAERGLRRDGAPKTSVSYGAPVSGIDANGNPVFFQPSKDGGAPAIVPGVKPKPDQPKAPTEIQAKAGTFHSQMVSASNELGTLAREGFDPSKVRTQVETSVAGGITNPIAGEKAQRARQAQEQWSEAFLRVKTGAAATQGEVDRNIRTFFPQIGDTPQVIAQKARMRKQAEDDVASMAGPAQQAPQSQALGVDLQELARQELKRRGKGK